MAPATWCATLALTRAARLAPWPRSTRDRGHGSALGTPVHLRHMAGEAEELTRVARPPGLGSRRPRRCAGGDVVADAAFAPDLNRERLGLRRFPRSARSLRRGGTHPDAGAALRSLRSPRPQRLLVGIEVAYPAQTADTPAASRSFVADLIGEDRKSGLEASSRPSPPSGVSGSSLRERDREATTCWPQRRPRDSARRSPRRSVRARASC